MVPAAFEIQLGWAVQATGSGRPSLRAPDQPEPPLRAHHHHPDGTQARRTVTSTPLLPSEQFVSKVVFFFFASYLFLSNYLAGPGMSCSIGCS